MSQSQGRSLSLEPTWPVLISLHHIPESWPHLWKLPSGSYQRSAAGQRAGKGRQWRATKVMWGEWHRRHVQPLIYKDAYWWSLSPTVCVTAADGWRSVSRTHANSLSVDCFQFVFPGVAIYPLRWNIPILFSENTSCWSVCCCCSHQVWCCSRFDPITSKGCWNYSATKKQRPQLHYS